MKISLNLKENSYDIIVERGALKNADKHLNLNRKVLIVTDEGVPSVYAKTLEKLAYKPVIATICQGEEAKSFENYEKLLKIMLKNSFTRGDAVVAVGGGVCGDLAGFVASSFMRGVDFYNIPTTVLSQVDSSIGGKTAINLDGVKNIVGAFYQPKKVLIDTELLETLPKRQISNGLVEAVKMALTCDKELFEFIEENDVFENLENIITRAILIKKDVVEKDEKEKDLRKVLNFGHTLGHGIETTADDIYHGEAVAVGMTYMCSNSVKKRLEKVLDKLGISSKIEIDKQKVLEKASHDKKSNGKKISAVFANEVGSFEFKEVDEEFLKERLMNV